MPWPAHSVNEGGRLGIFGGGACRRCQIYRIQEHPLGFKHTSIRVLEGGRLDCGCLVFVGGALLGIGAVSWYMYHNKTLPGIVSQLCMSLRLYFQVW